VSEITEISSVLDQGIQELEELEELALEEHPNFREKIPEIKAVRIFMTVHDGKCNGVIARKLEMNSWSAKQIRTFLPLTCVLGMCIFGYIYGLPVAIPAVAITLFITRMAMENIFGEPNKYTHHQVKSVVYRAFKELDFDAVDPKHIRTCSIEIELSFPRAYPFTNPQEKAYILCTLDNRGVEQLLL
jgi:hypothetical protein